jgi:hypothetical protein
MCVTRLGMECPRCIRSPVLQTMTAQVADNIINSALPGVVPLLFLPQQNINALA